MEYLLLVLNGKSFGKVLPKHVQMYKFCFGKEIYLIILSQLITLISDFVPDFICGIWCCKKLIIRVLRYMFFL